ncbi:MAG: DNA/RNA non-specific endonuclease [Aerococcus sp.]|nr:DNA/RNA non-specific endonuclease [Aerococcus sp.]
MSLATIIMIIAILIPVIGLMTYFNNRSQTNKKKKTSASPLLTLPVGLILLLVAFMLSDNADGPTEVFYDAEPGAAQPSSPPTQSAPATTNGNTTAPPETASAPDNDITSPVELSGQERPDQLTIPDVPDDQTYVTINNNIPYFTDEDLTATEPYANYGQLDTLGRVTVADALLDEELMPANARGQMDSSIKPTGWKQKRYDSVSGGWLYNRSHLIGFQLTGSENDKKNLMTGTRWFNVEGMLPFENFVANYIEQTGNRVRYRITPIFEGNNLLASGIFMEGYSVDDDGEGLCFNVYVPNRQPGITIDYSDGSNHD